MDSKQLAAQANVVAAIAEAIRELGSVPSGHFYAQVCGKLDLQSYDAVIALLKRAGLVSEHNHVLSWTGPKIGA